MDGPALGWVVMVLLASGIVDEDPLGGACDVSTALRCSHRVGVEPRIGSWWGGCLARCWALRNHTPRGSLSLVLAVRGDGVGGCGG